MTDVNNNINVNVNELSKLLLSVVSNIPDFSTPKNNSILNEELKKAGDIACTGLIQKTSR